MNNHSRSFLPIKGLACALAVLALPVLADQARAPGHRGRVDTYTAYEMRLQKVVTVWPDVHAVTARQPDGTFVAVLLDANDQTLSERRIAVPNVFLQSDATMRADEMSSPSRANEQMERDYRLRQGADMTADRMPSRVTMDFGDFVTDTFRDAIVPPKQRTEGTAYSTFHTVLRDSATGEQLGILRWFAKEQVLVWRIEKMGALGEGLVTSERLAKIGGWPFAPDMVWGGIQTLALRDSAGRVQAARFKTETAGFHAALDCDGIPDGCTGLHWLDGTIFQDCCDAHDICYEYDPPDGCCGALSWIFPTSWHCAICNAEVLYCFLTANDGGGGPGPGGGGGGGGGGCTTGGATPWCPPECFSCGRELY